MASEFLAQEQHARMMHAESQQQQHQVMQQQPVQQTAGGDWAEELMAQQKMNVTEGETDWAAQFQAEHEDSWVNEYTTEGVCCFFFLDGLDLRTHQRTHAPQVQTFGVEGEAPVDFETKSSDCKFFKVCGDVAAEEAHEVCTHHTTCAVPRPSQERRNRAGRQAADDSGADSGLGGRVP